MTEAKEGAMTNPAVLTTVSDLKSSSASPEEVTETTDNSNEFDDEGMEGKENSAAVSKIDNKSTNAATSKLDSETSSQAKPDKTNNKASRRRKRSLSGRIVFPPQVLSFDATLTNGQRQESQPESEDDVVVIDGDTQKKTTLEQESSIDDKNEDDSSMEDPKTGKRPHTSAEKTILPNKKQNTQNDSQPSKPEDISSNQMEIEENDNTTKDPFQQPNDEALDSPSRETQFKLPPELAPFNNPGVCDYGVIRASRLRNRTKKAIGNDVPYQNIQGQRRCRATKDGKKMIGPGNTNRCLNCAEGVFKYCHSHRDLDEVQKEYWEKRKLRDSKIGSASSYARENVAKKEPPVKTDTKAIKTESKSIKSTMHRSIATMQKQCIQVPGNDFEENEPRRCVALVQGKGRCFRKMLLTESSGFCYGHSSLAEKLREERSKNYSTNYAKNYYRRVGAMNCTAVSRSGGRCKFRALDDCVFCLTHINSPPKLVCKKLDDEENAGSVLNAESMGEPTKGSARKRGQSRSIAMESNMASTINGLKDFASNVLGKAKKSRKLRNDEVPKNIEFRKRIELSDEQIEKATSFDNMCFNVYKSKRCWYKRAEGAILCYQCLVCHEEGTKFDHILNKAASADESILFSSQCVKFEKGKQCSRTAANGNILCRECLQLTKFGLEPSKDSRPSNADSSSNDSDSSSSATFSSDSDSEDSLVSDDTNYDAYCMAYTHKEFFDMWKNWEKKTERMDEVEDSRLIKRANNTMSPTDTDGQVKAQYGRVLPHAMKKMIKILELRRQDVFLDIGHGVGNTCLHASFCIGCDSRGIEVVSDRHEIADKFRGGMYAEHSCNRNDPKPEVGKVDLRLGRLEDPKQKEFLTKGITRAYVNNFNGVFAERSSKNKDEWFLDDYISGIFASMAPGAIMVTFHPLNLGLDRESANELRSKHNLRESDHASYYDSEKILLGKAFCSVKWNKRSGNTNEIYVYKYRRLHQPGHHDAVFLCSNPSCKLANDMVPIPATTKNEDGRCVINHCKCKFSPKNLRKRGNKQTSP